jgi:hypothetical protein
LKVPEIDASALYLLASKDVPAASGYFSDGRAEALS